MRGKFPREAVIILGLLATVGIFFASKWIFAGAWFTGDMISFESPLEHLMGRYQRGGEVPMWVPEIHGGYPLLANGNISFWYLPHFVLRMFLPGPVTVNVSLLLHAALGAGGMYAWLRFNRLPAPAAAMAGLLYVFGGAMGARLALSNFYTAMVWVPLLVLLLQRYISSGRAQFLFWWVLACTLHIFSGNPQAVAIGLCIEAVMVGIFLWQRRSLRPLFALGGAGLLVLLLTSAHILPLLYHVPQTERAQGLAESELLEFNFPWEAWRGLVVPHPYGHGEMYRGPKGEAEIAAYVGPVALILAIGGFLIRSALPRSLQLGAVAFILMGAALSLGGDSLIYRWAIAYSPLRFFANPARYFLFVHLALTVAAAGGASLLYSAIDARWRPWLLGIIFAGAALPVVAVAWTWEPGIAWQELSVPKLVPSLLAEEEEGRLISFPHLIDEAPDNDFGITVWESVRKGVVLQQTFRSPFPRLRYLRLKFSPAAGATDSAITVRLRNIEGNVLHEASLPAGSLIDGEWTSTALPDLAVSSEELLTLELTSELTGSAAPRAYIHVNPGKTEYDPTGELSKCRKVCEVVAGSGSGSADLAFALAPPEVLERPAQQLLGPNVAAGYGVNSAQWTGSMGVAAVALYHKTMGEGRAALTRGRGLLNRLAVSDVVTAALPHREIDEEFELLLQHREQAGPLVLRSYRNGQAASRIHYASFVRAAQGSAEQLELLSELPAEDSATVVADVGADTSFEAEGTFTLASEAARELVIQTDRDGAGFLVVRDLWLPGWHASLDGERVPLHRADAIFRGVAVPAGKHLVRMWYQPAWIPLVSVLTTAGIAVIAVWSVALFSTLPSFERLSGRSRLSRF